MSLVDEAPQIIGRAVGRVRREPLLRAVPPTVTAVTVHRHQLDRGHAEVGERIELVGGRAERAAAHAARRVEAAHVELVDDGGVARRRREWPALPGVAPRIDDHRFAAVDHARARVDARELDAVLHRDRKVVALPRMGAVDAGREHARRLERELPTCRQKGRLTDERDRPRVGRPDAELDAALVGRRAHVSSARRHRKRRRLAWPGGRRRRARRPDHVGRRRLLRLGSGRRSAGREAHERHHQATF